jgi:hypothetical protein
VFDPSNPRRDNLGGVVAPPVEWGFIAREPAEMEVVGNGAETATKSSTT